MAQANREPLLRALTLWLTVGGLTLTAVATLILVIAGAWFRTRAESGSAGWTFYTSNEAPEAGAVLSLLAFASSSQQVGLLIAAPALALHLVLLNRVRRAI
jgi:heme/copper-type cytochrome/quinol oxidase subunit 1